MTEGEYKELLEIMNDASNHRALTPWEKDFVRNILTNLGRFGRHMTYSVKQKEVVLKIERKIYAVG